MDVVKIGLIGAGTVGSGVINLIDMNEDKYEELLGTKVEIKKIAIKDLKEATPGMPKDKLTDDAMEVINDPDIEIVVEVMGGIEVARKFIAAALRAGKHVVTANKDLMATHGQELLKIADEMGKYLYFEASVAGALPIIDMIKDPLISNRITKVMGIINGTTNFILTKMFDEGRSLDDVLKEAQDLGYAEADPTSDIEGLDAARKIAILASISFHSSATFDDVYVEGITKIEVDDIRYAKQFNSTIKLLGIARQNNGAVEVVVYPTLLPLNHPLAKVDDVYNAVYVEGNGFDDLTLIGKGAGSLPTASAVVGNVLSIVKDIKNGTVKPENCTCYLELPIQPIEAIENHFYIRMVVEDKPGVLCQISSIFADNEVSIDSVIQKKLDDGKAELVLLTDKVMEGKFQKARQGVEGLEVVYEVKSVLRSDKDN